jgi:hypothetical protein
MALDSLIATRVLFRGMAEGWFTKKKLGDYFSDTKDDPHNARDIINPGDDEALIAGYHYTFLDAIRKATLGGSTVAPTAPEPAYSYLIAVSSDAPIEVKLLDETGKEVGEAGA